MKTIKSFIESSNVPASLIRACVVGLSGWDYFKEDAENVSNHGASGGYGSFCYHSDTIKFTTKNRKAIVSLLEEQAKDYGIGVIEMVKGFGGLNDDYTYEEVAKALYGVATQDSKTALYNILAWYALEEVCRSYCDLVESENN